MLLSRWGKWSGIAGLVGALAGCGSPPPAETPGGAGAASPATEPASAPLPPLEPAAAPAALIVRLRINNTVKLLNGGFEAAGVPFEAADLKEFGELFRGGILLNSVDPALPIEGLVALNPDSRRPPYVVFSAGVRDLAQATREVASRGAQEGPAGNQFFRSGKQHCALGRALGPSPARVACADTEDGLHQLLPFALRGLPLEKLSDADVYFDLDFKPLRAAYGRQARSLRLLASVFARQFYVDEQRFDSALSDAAVGLADEIAALSEDLDRAQGEVRENAGQFKADLSLTFAKDSSFLAGTSAAWGRSTGPAPALFDRLPATATGASYTRPLPAERLQPLRQILIDLAVGYAQSEKFTKPFQTRLEKVVGGLLYLGTEPTVQATGPLVTSSVGESVTLAPAWQIWGSKRPLAEMTTLFSELALLVSSSEVARWAEGPDWIPTFKKQSGTLQGVPGAVVYEWKLPPKLRELGSDTLRDASKKGGAGGPETRELELLTRDKSFLASWMSGYVAVASVDGATYVAVGADREQLAEPLRLLAQKDSARLANASELSAFRTREAQVGGFSKVAALASFVAPFLPDKLALAFPSLLQSTPHHGQVPATFFIQVSQEPTTTVRATWEAPREFITDLAALVVLSAAELPAKKK